MRKKNTHSRQQQHISNELIERGGDVNEKKRKFSAVRAAVLWLTHNAFIYFNRLACFGQISTHSQPWWFWFLFFIIIFFSAAATLSVDVILSLPLLYNARSMCSGK